MTSNFVMDGQAPGTPDNVYEVLRVHPAVSDEDLRRQFRKEALKHHPDKQNLAHNRPADGQNKWDELAQVKQVVSNPIKRLLHDMQKGLVPDTIETHHRVHLMKKAQAELEQANMELEVERIRQYERERNGLLVLEAKYGLLDPDPEYPIGPWLDVTIPVQCLVQDSKIILDQSSKFWLEGFYDPTLGETDKPLEMYLKYEFLGGLHEVVFADEEEVKVPIREHLVDAPRPSKSVGPLPLAQQEPVAPLPSPPRANRHAVRGLRAPAAAAAPVPSLEKQYRQQLEDKQKKKARRRMLFFTFGALATGGYVYVYHRETASSKLELLGKWFLDLMDRAGLDKGVNLAALYFLTLVTQTTNGREKALGKYLQAAGLAVARPGTSQVFHPRVHWVSTWPKYFYPPELLRNFVEQFSIIHPQPYKIMYASYHLLSMFYSSPGDSSD
eukprot:g78145.t1